MCSPTISMLTLRRPLGMDDIEVRWRTGEDASVWGFPVEKCNNSSSTIISDVLLMVAKSVFGRLSRSRSCVQNETMTTGT
jgi:hypothetical protein